MEFAISYPVITSMTKKTMVVVSLVVRPYNVEGGGVSGTFSSKTNSSSGVRLMQLRLSDYATPRLTISQRPNMLPNTLVEVRKGSPDRVGEDKLIESRRREVMLCFVIRTDFLPFSPLFS